MLLNDTELTILEEFVGDYKARLTGSSIAKKKKLNQKTVSNYLKRLEEQNFLKSITEGKNKLYSLNLQDEQLIVNFISSVENARAINFYKKNPLIKEIIAKSLPSIKGIALIFGSYAKGTQKKESDLDIFIAGKIDKKEINKIEDVYHVEINIKAYPLAAFKKALEEKDPLVEEAIKSHIIIQNAQEFASFVRWVKHGKG